MSKVVCTACDAEATDIDVDMMWKRHYCSECGTLIAEYPL